MRHCQKYPSIKKSLDKLAGKISEDDMIQMNYEVTVQHKKAGDVAHDYLKQQGLID